MATKKTQKATPPRQAPKAEQAANDPSANKEDAKRRTKKSADVGVPPAAIGLSNGTAAPAAKAARKTSASKAGIGRGQKMSALDAAAKVLKEGSTTMNCKEMIAEMAAKGYWASPAGRTPESTLYAAILRETKIHGDDARFRKTERGKFQYTGK